MKRIYKNTHFDLIRGDKLKDYGNQIIQLEVQYENNNYNVYLCEVKDEGEEKGEKLK